MASLDLGLEEVWVRLTPAERLWALKRDVVVPYPSIVDVEACPKDELERGWMRVGTSWPGRYHAGRFRTRGEPWSLWLVGSSEEVLVMDLRDHSFGRIVLELDDPAASAQELRSRL